MRATLHIERLSKLGDGVASHEGRTAFVEGALPGETVEVDLELSGKVLRGTLVQVLTPSPSRRPPPCPLADRCGGCDWLHADERLQREQKGEIVLSALEHLGGIPRASIEVRPLAVSPKSMGYRRRAVLHFSGGELSFYGRRSHDTVVVASCPALAQPIAEIPGKLSPLLSAIHKDVEAVHLLSEGDAVAFAISLKAGLKPKHQEVVEKAIKALGLKGAVITPAEGKGGPVIVGKPALRALLPLRPEVPLFVRPDAFAQANAEGNVALVASAIYELGAKDSDRVLELYSGNGNFTFALAATSREVLAVEGAPVSSQLAARSAQEGGVSNVRFVQQDAKKAVEGLLKGGEKFDLLLADPPRTGAPGIGEWAKRLSVRGVVYVACDPGALARDAADLRDHGFTPKALQVVDLFPQTRHVEAVMSFRRAGLT